MSTSSASASSNASLKRMAQRFSNNRSPPELFFGSDTANTSISSSENLFTGVLRQLPVCSTGLSSQVLCLYGRQFSFLILQDEDHIDHANDAFLFKISKLGGDPASKFVPRKPDYQESTGPMTLLCFSVIILLSYASSIKGMRR